MVIITTNGYVFTLHKQLARKLQRSDKKREEIIAEMMKKEKSISNTTDNYISMN